MWAIFFFSRENHFAVRALPTRCVEAKGDTQSVRYSAQRREKLEASNSLLFMHISQECGPKYIAAYPTLPANLQLWVWSSSIIQRATIISPFF